MIRTLVTGATGFVGRAVVERLRADGHDVVAASRRASGAPERGTNLVVGDIETTAWSTHLTGVDTVVHLAARVHQMRDRSEDPLAVFRRVNRDATVRLAEAARSSGVRRFVFLSSIKAALDKTGVEAVDETALPSPASPYGISKWEAELALFAMQDMEVVVLRPPVVYGPGVKGNIRSFLKLAKLGVPLPLAAIANRRSFVGLGNLAAAISLASTAPNIQRRAFYVADETLSTPELFRRLARAVGKRARLFSVPASAMEAVASILRRRDLIERLTGSLAVTADAFRQTTGWAPAISMTEELERMAESFDA